MYSAKQNTIRQWFATPGLNCFILCKKPYLALKKKTNQEKVDELASHSNSFNGRLFF